MERALILETTFLIDFERERRSGRTATFLKEHADFRLFITHTIAGELAAAKSLSGRDRWQAFIAPFHILPFSENTAWEYGNAYRFLQANGLMIGANDLWIAATAIAHEVPLVTRNLDHFKRVPGLDVLSYA